MRRKHEYVKLPQGFDIETLAEKICSAVSSMDYESICEKIDGGIAVTVSRDMGGMDIFLGRCQRFRVNLAVSGRTLSVTFSDRTVIDKLICVIVGVCTFALAWITALIARSARRNAESVVLTTIGDYIAKERNNEA